MLSSISEAKFFKIKASSLKDLMVGSSDDEDKRAVRLPILVTMCVGENPLAGTVAATTSKSGRQDGNRMVGLVFKWSD